VFVYNFGASAGSNLTKLFHVR